jgi:hypothetical protein
MVTLPPESWLVDIPATTRTSPPTPCVDDPGWIVIPPALASKELPVVYSSAPDGPFDDPVVRATDPLDARESAEEITTDPEFPEADIPLVTIMLPPSLDVLPPAEIATLPPGESPENPAVRLTAPAVPEALKDDKPKASPA